MYVFLGGGKRERLNPQERKTIARTKSYRFKSEGGVSNVQLDWLGEMKLPQKSDMHCKALAMRSKGDEEIR